MEFQKNRQRSSYQNVNHPNYYKKITNQNNNQTQFIQPSATTKTHLSQSQSRQKQTLISRPPPPTTTTQISQLYQQSLPKRTLQQQKLNPSQTKSTSKLHIQLSPSPAPGPYAIENPIGLPYSLNNIPYQLQQQQQLQLQNYYPYQPNQIQAHETNYNEYQQIPNYSLDYQNQYNINKNSLHGLHQQQQQLQHPQPPPKQYQQYQQSMDYQMPYSNHKINLNKQILEQNLSNPLIRKEIVTNLNNNTKSSNLNSIKNSQIQLTTKNPMIKNNPIHKNNLTPSNVPHMNLNLSNKPIPSSNTSLYTTNSNYIYINLYIFIF